MMSPKRRVSNWPHSDTPDGERYTKRKDDRNAAQNGMCDIETHQRVSSATVSEQTSKLNEMKQ